MIGATLLKNRKRGALSSYLERIDSTYNEYAVDREECRTRLERLKRDVIELLNKGKIDEGHFLMLDEKITQYLKDLTLASPKYKRTVMDNGAPTETSVSQENRFCSNCGAKLSREDKVCKKCGTTQA